MAHLNKKSNQYKDDIEKVSLYILSLHGNFKIPFKYFDTIMTYRNRYKSKWKIRINFAKDDKMKKWPKSFDFYQVRQ
jgi:hypothetical protein